MDGNGGVYAILPNTCGRRIWKKWHDAGSVQKQNVFDDFIAAAEYLLSKIYFFRFRVLIEMEVYSGCTQGDEISIASSRSNGHCVTYALRAGSGWAYDYGTTTR
jgi:prolyl oligopeptidase